MGLYSNSLIPFSSHNLTYEELKPTRQFVTHFGRVSHNLTYEELKHHSIVRLTQRKECHNLTYEELKLKKRFPF